MEHITSENERWDTIAEKYYGDPYLYEPIIRSNPEVVPVGYVASPLLPSGISITIPLIVVPPSIADDVSPTWAVD